MSLFVTERKARKNSYYDKRICYKLVLVNRYADGRVEYISPFKGNIFKSFSKDGYSRYRNNRFSLEGETVQTSNYSSYEDDGRNLIRYTDKNGYFVYEVAEGYIHAFDSLQDMDMFFSNVPGWLEKYRNNIEIWKCCIPSSCCFYEGEIYERHLDYQGTRPVYGIAAGKLDFLEELEYVRAFPKKKRISVMFDNLLKVIRKPYKPNILFHDVSELSEETKAAMVAMAASLDEDGKKEKAAVAVKNAAKKGAKAAIKDIENEQPAVSSETSKVETSPTLSPKTSSLLHKLFYEQK